MTGMISFNILVYVFIKHIYYCGSLNNDLHSKTIIKQSEFTDFFVD